MENPGNPRSISRDQKRASSPENKFASRTRQGTKLRDILKGDKPVKSNLSYSNFHQEITRNPNTNLPKSLDSQQNQVLNTPKKVPTEDELVRYMSNLPSYLEKGKNYQDKALNVGVLDWKRLEKWRCCQKQMPGQQNGCSPSSSSSSYFSTDSSSVHSSRGLSCSPTHQRVHRLSLQSTLEESRKESHVRDAKFPSGRGQSCSPMPQFSPQKIPQKFQDSPVNTGNNLGRQHRVFGGVQLERKESALKSVSEMGKRQALDKYEVGAPWKGKSKTQGIESSKETIKSLETKFVASNQDFSLRERSGNVSMSRDQSNHECSKKTSISSSTVNGRLSVDPCQKSILERKNLEADLCKNDHKKQLKPSESSSQLENGTKSSSQQSNISLNPTKTIQCSVKNNSQGVKGASQVSNMLSFPSRIFSSPSRYRNAEEKKPPIVQGSEEIVARRNSSSVPKSRNPSPIWRLGSAMGKAIKNATGSRDNSPVRRSISKERGTKCGPEGVSSSTSIDNPYNEKTTTSINNRGRSSPLRRLFDPLLKPRASNYSEPSKKQSSSTIGTCNGDNTTLLKAQALLQVSFKNGLPLFTFAIDNESNILAATVRKSRVPGKGHHIWTYTFFTIREFKRKSGSWLSQGGKSDGQGYVPNVVAQMKVSDSPSSFTKPENGEHSITREFDLFEVDGDQYANDFHPTNELAAIVVKLSRNTVEQENDTTKEGDSSYNWVETPQDSRENFQETKSLISADHSIKSVNLSSTIILPGGVHTIPSKGEISTLAERWRSGGLCDCGGWDLGCQLRVYTNKNQNERRTSSSGTLMNKGKFQLFSQGNQDVQSILSLAPFKERIYSVEFSSSLSVLQAFAICMSFIDCKRPPELPEPSTITEKVTEACVFDVAMQTKASIQGEVPGKYVSNPPHSPVGRV